MVEGIYRNVAENQGGARLVSATSPRQRMNADHRVDPFQVSDGQYNKVHALMFS